MNAISGARVDAFRAADALQIDAAKGWLEHRHGLDHALDGVGGDLDVEQRAVDLQGIIASIKKHLMQQASIAAWPTHRDDRETPLRRAGMPYL